MDQKNGSRKKDFNYQIIRFRLFEKTRKCNSIRKTCSAWECLGRLRPILDTNSIETNLLEGKHFIYKTRRIYNRIFKSIFILHYNKIKEPSLFTWIIYQGHIIELYDYLRRSKWLITWYFSEERKTWFREGKRETNHGRSKQQETVVRDWAKNIRSSLWK